MNESNESNDSARTPLDMLLGRIQEALGGFGEFSRMGPETLRDRLRPVLDGFSDQFELVSRREYEAHLKTMERLETTVADLEARIAELEGQR
ncbi:MAG: hypothetical protein AAGE43_12050 [Pseudomonadota bacterium]